MTEVEKSLGELAPRRVFINDNRHLTDEGIAAREALLGEILLCLQETWSLMFGLRAAGPQLDKRPRQAS